METVAFLRPRLLGAFVLALTLAFLVAGATATADYESYGNLEATSVSPEEILESLKKVLESPEAILESPEEIPRLKGVWKGTGSVKTIHITGQRSRRFSGYSGGADEPKNFFGTVFSDNKTLYLVYDAGGGSNRGRLLNKDTMDVCYVGSGTEGVVGCTSFVRQKDLVTR